MSPLDETVLATLKASVRPKSNAELVTLLDCCETDEMSRSLYRLKKSCLIQVADEVRIGGKGKPVPRYEAIAAPQNLAGDDEDIDDSMPVDEPPMPRETYEDEAPQSTQRSEYEQMLSGHDVADDAEAALIAQVSEREMARRLNFGKPKQDPICRAIDRMQIGRIQGAADDARVLRYLADKLPDVDVAERLRLIAEKLEARA